MDFTELSNRLLDRLRRIVDSGTISESALARRIGISQSHLHNTLKGVRGLTLPMADQILANMQWNIWDLCSDVEVKEESARRKLPKSKCKELNVRALEHPDREGLPPLDARIAVPRILLANMAEPALFVVNSATDTTGLADPGDVLLTDLSSPAGLAFLPDAVYLFLLDGRYLMRWARKGANCIYLAGAANWNQPHLWQRVVNSTSPIGRVHAIAKRQNGMFLRPAPPSSAN